jgi:hypothetical protein
MHQRQAAYGGATHPCSFELLTSSFCSGLSGVLIVVFFDLEAIFIPLVPLVISFSKSWLVLGSINGGFW